MRALEPEVFDAVFEQTESLLPAPPDHHPLGCHRPRVPDRICLWAMLVSTAIRISPQAAMYFPRGRPREVPGDGHWNSPGTATRTPRGRPRVGSGSVVEWLHPLARGGVGQAHRFPFGDDDVGMMEKPVDER